jgi:hypothetical protein
LLNRQPLLRIFSPRDELWEAYKKKARKRFSTSKRQHLLSAVSKWGVKAMCVATFYGIFVRLGFCFGKERKKQAT